MEPKLYDTHCHLDYADYDTDRDAAVERALAVGVARLIVIGTDLASSRQALALAQRHEGVYAVVGWHPGHATEAPADIRDELRELARQPKVVGIGETGMDYYRLPEGDSAAEQRDLIRRRQESLFVQQLEVAAELGLNCVVHQRASFEDTLRIMAPFAGRVRGVFHCFTDGLAEMQRVLAVGSLVSYTGIITFKNAASIRETAAAVPADRYMVETDSPFLAPVPFRGKRCEPAYVRYTAEAVAAARGCSLEQVSRETCATAEGFFRF